MKGTRPLDNNEIRRVSTCFTGTFEIRNSGLFMLGVSIGRCVGERNRNHLLYNSMREIDDETLITEIRNRGYKLLDLRDDEATGEVVQIGKIG